MNVNKQTANRIAEQRIDKEIARRTDRVHVHHITGISRKINGMTLVTARPIRYGDILEYIVRTSYKLDEKYGDVFPGNLKEGIRSIDIDSGIAICDHRDQFDHAAGRRKAKRSWLRLHPR